MREVGVCSGVVLGTQMRDNTDLIEGIYTETPGRRRS